ncbi:MAG: hypothetical protein U0T82_03890 [Bacteroidales bacterium]
MKDTVFTAKQKKRELWFLGGCFLLANILNGLAIVRFDTSWSELFTQLPVIILVSFLLYGLFLLVRLVYVGLKNLVRRPKD